MPSVFLHVTLRHNFEKLLLLIFIFFWLGEGDVCLKGNCLELASSQRRDSAAADFFVLGISPFFKELYLFLVPLR